MSFKSIESREGYKVDGSVDREGIKDLFERWKKTDIIDLLLRDSDRFIARDEHIRVLSLLVGISGYTDEPLNLFLKGESSSGKTYVSRTILERYFPEEDVWMLGGISPKALVRLHVVEMTADGRRVDQVPVPQKPIGNDRNNPKKLDEYEAQLREYQELVRNSYTLIDLRGRILLFLEPPDPETFNVLRPILSHDKDMIRFPVVEKTEKGQQRTKQVIVRGWPSTIFCTTSIKYVEELATRSITISPQTTEEKVKEALRLIDEQDAYPWKFKDTEDTLFIRKVISHIKHIAQEYKVIIPFPSLHEAFPKHLVRFMRDFRHLKGIIKAITYLRFPNREIVEKDGQKYILANVDDVMEAVKLLIAVFETTVTGTEDRILRFYHDVVLKKEEWKVKELTQEYNKHARKKVSSRTIRRWLETLEELNLVDSEPDPDDKRVLIYRPVKGQEIVTIRDRQDLLVDLLEKGYEEWLENNRDIMPHIVRSESSVLPDTTSYTRDDFVSRILSRTAQKSGERDKPGISACHELSRILGSSQGDKDQESAIPNNWTYQESTDNSGEERCKSCAYYGVCSQDPKTCKRFLPRDWRKKREERIERIYFDDTKKKNRDLFSLFSWEWI